MPLPPLHVAFFFSQHVESPSGTHKPFYVTQGMIRRGIRVTWIQLGNGKFPYGKHFGINFRSYDIPDIGIIRFILALLRSIIFCKIYSVKCVYADDWFYFRHQPMKILASEILLKLMGIKFVLDQHDPYIEYEMAFGRLPKNSPEYRKTLRAYSLIFRLADLIILPSMQYEDIVSQYVYPKSKLFGTFRGIDTKLFNPNANGVMVRSKLQLEGKFVVGYFARMGRYRQIEQITIPLIQRISSILPNAHFLVGGEGPLASEFIRLQKESDAVPLTFVGFVRYNELPQYISACDVLLCTVDSSIHSQNTISLKIFETLAVGRPIIASRTRATDRDYKKLEGVVWTRSDLDSFVSALRRVHDDYPRYSKMAYAQAMNFEEYSLESTIPRIADRVIRICHK